MNNQLWCKNCALKKTCHLYGFVDTVCDDYIEAEKNEMENRNQL